MLSSPVENQLVAVNLIFFNISPLKSLNLYFIPSVKLSCHQGTWTGCLNGVTPCEFIYLFIFCLEAMLKRTHVWKWFSSRLWKLFQNCHSESYLISAIFKVLNNCEVHWQGYLKYILQLNVLRTWINIRINSFLDKYDETKIGEGVLEIISCTKIRPCSLKNIAPRHFTYYCIIFFLWNKLSFQIQRSFDWIILCKTCLSFYLLIVFVSWSSFSACKLFI